MRDPLQPEEDLFAAALEQPAATRAAWLRTACPDDAALRARVESLLAAHEAPDRLLDGVPATEFAAALAGAPEALTADLTGHRLGPYLLTERLGEGGVGIVYAAQQDAPLRRTVALKLIKPGMDTREVIARFEAERQALAVMDHPGIAQVFDAGTTPEGRPYFVMELVRGVPITRYCDEQKLPPRARLELFARVCEAVQHAHQKGVIHRDLKPSNLLVTAEGQPKIIDFGIAKATSHAPGAGTTFVTALTQFVGTPAYMSPEQATAQTAGVDTRSDIYSLGVLLHEMLTGRTPYEPRALLAAGLDEMRRRIREEEPARPSTLLEKLDRATLQDAAALRQLEPARLIHSLRGELDWIILRCLEKSPDRRYPTAHDLAADIGRHLRDEPVTAVAPSAFYTLRKLVRRHRAAVLTAAAFALVLLIATILSTSYGVRATRAERAAETRRLAAVAARTEADLQRAAALAAERHASDEAAIAEAVVKFLQRDVLAQAAPDNQPDRDLKVRTALDNASARVATAFPDKPLLEAAVREALGVTYGSLGEYEIARQHYEVALRLRRAALGDRDPKTLGLLKNLLAQLGNLERFPEAEKLGVEALALHRAAFGTARLETLEVMVNLGSNRLQEGKAAEALPLLREAYTTARQVLGPENSLTLIALSNYGTCQIGVGNYAEAEPLLEELVAVRRRLLGPTHPRTLNVLQSLSGLYGRLHRDELAANTCVEVYEGRRTVLGPEAAPTLVALKNLGDARDAQGRYAEAATHYASALAAQTKLLGPDHRRTLGLASALGAMQAQTGRATEAEPLLRDALARQQKTRGPAHLETTETMLWLGLALHHLGRDDEATPLLREAHALRLKNGGPTQPSTLDAARCLGVQLLATGHADEGATLLLATLPALAEHAGADDMATFQCAVALARARLDPATRERANTALAPVRPVLEKTYAQHPLAQFLAPPPRR